MDYGGSNEENDSESAAFSNADSDEYNLYVPGAFDMGMVEANLINLSQITAEACVELSGCP